MTNNSNITSKDSGRKITIELDYDFIDTLVVQTLQQAKQGAQKDIKRLKQLGKAIEEYQQADLDYNKKLVKAMDRVLHYYGADDERTN